MDRTPEDDGAKPTPVSNQTRPARPTHLRAVDQAAQPDELHSKRRKPRKSKTTKHFFDKALPHSIVKSEIVSKYFAPWARIMKRVTRTRSRKIAYVDLYAGRGRYDDGTPSTPLRILDAILKDDELRQMSVTFFADADPDYVDALRANVAALPGIDSLTFPPIYSVGAAHEHGIEQYYQDKAVVPTFMFLDPFGYHGLSTKLMRSILKDFGCEIAFFFKYTRIRAALRNRVVREQMDALFGRERVEALRAALPSIRRQEEKEQRILAALEDALRGIGAKYVLPFRFLNEDGNVTHHLVFVTKNELAYDIMKEIMWGASTGKRGSVATFEFRPGASSDDEAMLLPLFAPERPLDNLKADLIERYRGKRMSIEQIYRNHNYGTRYVKRNYSEALRQLYYEDGKVSAERGALKMPLNAKSRHPMPFEETWITFDKA